VLANVARDRREYGEAEALYEVALQGLPNDPEAHHEYGEYLWDVGRCEEAVAEQRRALRIEPQSSRAAGYLAMTLVCAGRIEEGVGQLRRTIVEFGGVHQSGATFSFVEGGRVEEGIEYARSVGGGWFLTIAEGVRDGVRRAADLDVRLPTYQPVAAWGLTLLGDDEEALRIVESCVEGPCPVGQLAWLWMPTVQRRLGENPRFQAALREIGMLR